MTIWFFRALFIMAAAAVTFAFGKDADNPFLWLVCGILASGAIVMWEAFLTTRPVALISSVVFGTLVGLLFAVVAHRVVLLVASPVYTDPAEQLAFERDLSLVLIVVFVYLGIAFLYQTRDRFRVVIPFVEFRR